MSDDLGPVTVPSPVKHDLFIFVLMLSRVEMARVVSNKFVWLIELMLEFDIKYSTQNATRSVYAPYSICYQLYAYAVSPKVSTMRGIMSTLQYVTKHMKNIVEGEGVSTGSLEVYDLDTESTAVSRYVQLCSVYGGDFSMPDIAAVFEGMEFDRPRGDVLEQYSSCLARHRPLLPEGQCWMDALLLPDDIKLAAGQYPTCEYLRACHVVDIFRRVRKEPGGVWHVLRPKEHVEATDHIMFLGQLPLDAILSGDAPPVAYTLPLPAPGGTQSRAYSGFFHAAAGVSADGRLTRRGISDSTPAVRMQSHIAMLRGVQTSLMGRIGVANDDTVLAELRVHLDVVNKLLLDCENSVLRMDAARSNTAPLRWLARDPMTTVSANYLVSRAPRFEIGEGTFAKPSARSSHQLSLLYAVGSQVSTPFRVSSAVTCDGSVDPRRCIKVGDLGWDTALVAVVFSRAFVKSVQWLSGHPRSYMVVGIKPGVCYIHFELNPGFVDIPFWTVSLVDPGGVFQVEGHATRLVAEVASVVNSTLAISTSDGLLASSALLPPMVR